MQKLKNYAFLSISLLFGWGAFGQTVLFTENFGTGCNSGIPLTAGTWSVTPTGANDPTANVWYISATEQGMTTGGCGDDGCISGGNDMTLHMGSQPNALCPAGDCGASYDGGSNSNSRAEITSPIDCSTATGTVYMKFNYVESSHAPDNGTVWVSINGGAWTQIDDPGATASGCQTIDYSGFGLAIDKGTWGFRNIAIPGAAGQANVRIGFNWTNSSSNAAAADPSFAVDNIVIIDSVTSTLPVVTVTGPTTLCIGQVGTYTATATSGAPITTWTWATNPVGSGTGTGQTNAASTSTINYSFATAGTYTVACAGTNASGTSNPPGTVVVTVSANLVPAVSIAPAGPCALQSSTITATPTNGGTAPTYQWFVNGTPQPGTSATFTTASLNVGDLVTCTMTSNSACASPTTANSNTLTAVNCSTNPTPSITSATLNGCVNQPISLSGSASPNSGAVSSWAWTSNPSANANFTAASAQNTQFTATAPGSYTVTLTVQPGGGTATTTLTISALPTVTVTPNADTVCIGGTGTTLTASGTSTTYTWTPSTGLSATTGTTVIANPTSNTTYTVTGTLNGCSNTASSQITALVVSPVVATAGANYVCTGSTTSITTSAPGALTYSWTPSTGLSCTNCGNPIVTALDTTVYTVTVTGQCFSNTSDTVNIYAVTCGPPVAGFVPSDTIICRYGCITYHDTSKYQPLQYLWVFQGGIPDTSYAQNPTVCYNVESANSPAGNGMYYVTLIVTNINGEKDTVVDSIKVNISPIANINNGQTYTTIDLGTSTTLDGATYSSGELYYTWTPNYHIQPSPNVGVITVDPQVNTQYILQVRNGLGCSDYDTILVKVEKLCGEVFIPTAFSPNGDGINDRALVKNNNCIRSLVFSIFDRWGEKVFYTEDPTSIGWDGVFKGKPMDAGVFVYYVDAVLSDNTTVSQKGNITLVR